MDIVWQPIFWMDLSETCIVYLSRLWSCEGIMAFRFRHVIAEDKCYMTCQKTSSSIWEGFCMKAMPLPFCKRAVCLRWICFYQHSISQCFGLSLALWRHVAWKSTKDVSMIICRPTLLIDASALCFLKCNNQLQRNLSEKIGSLLPWVRSRLVEASPVCIVCASTMSSAGAVCCSA